MSNQEILVSKANLDQVLGRVKEYMDTRAGNGLSFNKDTGKYDIDVATDEEIDAIISSVTDIFT